MLLIFLGYLVVPSGRILSGFPNAILGHTSRSFWRFGSMGYTTKFHHNLDTVCITKTSNQDSSQQLSRASCFLSSSLVIFNSEYPRATLLQPASLVKESNRYQKVVLYYVQRTIYLNFVMEVFKI